MVLVMGSKEEDVPVEPVEKPVFVEDMTETELASAVCIYLFIHIFSIRTHFLMLSNFQLDLPGGLVNLGNTCYMNATVQCLKTVPELRESLRKYTGKMIQTN